MKRKELQKQVKEGEEAGGKAKKMGLDLTPGNEDFVLAKRSKNLNQMQKERQKRHKRDLSGSDDD